LATETYLLEDASHELLIIHV